VASGHNREPLVRRGESGSLADPAWWLADKRDDLFSPKDIAAGFHCHNSSDRVGSRSIENPQGIERKFTPAPHSFYSRRLCLDLSDLGLAFDQFLGPGHETAGSHPRAGLRLAPDPHGRIWQAVVSIEPAGVADDCGHDRDLNSRSLAPGSPADGIRDAQGWPGLCQPPVSRVRCDEVC